MIAIIDYRMGNLRSVEKAFEKIGAKVLVTSQDKDLEKAKAIVLPGVGAFGQGMKHLRDLGIIPTLLEEIKKGKPFLGICLGMQLLFSYSQEHGIYKGLDIIKGIVRRFPKNLKIPHMGWNQINKIKNQKSQVQKNDILEDIPDNTFFYFVHSYYCIPKDKDIVLATTDYGIRFVSVIQKDNIFGIQFHPEKSQNFGLKILKNFVKIANS